MEVDDLLVSEEQVRESLVGIACATQFQFRKRNAVLDPDVPRPIRGSSFAEEEFERFFGGVAGEHPEAGPHEAIARRFPGLDRWVAIGSRTGLRDSIHGHRVGAQKLRCLARQRAGLARQRLEEIRHTVRVEAGRGEQADADAVRLVLISACEVDRLLLTHALRARDTTGDDVTLAGRGAEQDRAEHRGHRQNALPAVRIDRP